MYLYSWDANDKAGHGSARVHLGLLREHRGRIAHRDVGPSLLTPDRLWKAFIQQGWGFPMATEIEPSSLVFFPNIL